MANYTKTTDFAAKDTLPGGDTNKVVRGSEFETEFDAISTAIATKSDTAGPTFTGTVTIPTVDINAGAIDGTTIGANSAAAGTFTNLNATTVDLDGGTLDGATIGGTTAGAGTFTNLTASGTVNFAGATISNLGTITTANLDGGTADNIVIGGSTPAAGTFTSVTATTADINGGTVDNVVIGGSTAAAGTFTALVATSATVGGSAVLTSVAFSDIDAGAVTLSSETFSDVDNQIPTNAAVIDYVAATIPLISEVNDLSAVVTWADVPDANITQSSVTQHQAALSITASQLSDVTATATELNYVDGVTSNIQTQIDSISPSPTLTATASGALANGDKVVINSDGTVSVVSETVGPPTAGTAVTWHEGTVTTYVHGSAYDANAQKVVIAYRDSSTDRGKVVVGTVSGNSISFGTAVQFSGSNDATRMALAYDANAQKIVIAYRDDTQGPRHGYAIVGTVSGTSISFGTSAEFENAEVDYIDIAYDASAQKVVIIYRDEGNSNYGTAIVGTVSGTSISYGTPAVFNSGNSTYTSIVYDSNSSKVVIAYRDEGNSYYGTAIVGTVSGTSISFGSEVVFNSAATLYGSSVYDANAQKVVIAYRDGGNSNYGTAVVGTVSGTSISFGTPVVFYSGNVGATLTAVYDSAKEKTLIAYRDQSGGATHLYLLGSVGTVSGTSISFGTAFTILNANIGNGFAAYDSNTERVVVSYALISDSDGESIVVQTDTTTTNLTAENYIGISDGAYSDTATATIQIVGSVDDAQTGLTAGQSYFVQGDGTLALTADDPSVFAGTAVSSTKLIVKG